MNICYPKHHYEQYHSSFYLFLISTLLKNYSIAFVSDLLQFYLFMSLARLLLSNYLQNTNTLIAKELCTPYINISVVLLIHSHDMRVL